MTTVRRRHTKSPALIAAATIFVIAMLLSGCNGDTPTDDSAAQTDQTQTGTDADSGFGCGDKLTAALTMLGPERLGISTDADLAEARLNTWLDNCGQSIDVAPPISPDIQQLLESALSPTQLKQLATDRFISDDAEHLRNCQMHKALSNIDFGTTENELERVVALFHYCVRNIALHSKPEDDLPLTSFGILMFGRGTAEDIAWVYTDLLRQLQIDSVIIRPTAAKDDQNNPWLVGVLLDKKCYLFDTRLGTPIPGAADDGKSATVMHPATLSEVLMDDGILRKLDRSAEDRYPLTAEGLKQLTVEVVGTRSLWTSPMQRLQTALSGEQSAVVYDGLQDEGDRPGLITRVVDSGGEFWAKQSVGVWPYPSKRITLSRQRDEQQRERLALLQQPQDAPFPIAIDPAANKLMIGNPERRHLRSRIMQLVGDFGTAIRNYQTLRIHLVTSARQPLPKKIRAIHERAEDDAAYWIGLCQFDNGSFESAVSTFRDYIRRYGAKPNAAWEAQGRMMLALSLAETGDWTEALFELEEAEELPEALAPRQAFCMARWKAAAKQKAE